ncbi:MFS transporter [Niabella soli]|uniref:MFS transporter n=1 Tax=Niabella soli DSM 19437 TaxID=929713 RepID=W0EX97_9BACT|nr:MFS transporter [Niabella soli]AHF15407.1 MFS transporter [Niabella soli DSM 19437]
MKQTTGSGTLRKVIGASSLGTLIEWYDFYIFGMLAKTISTEFFPEGNSTAALLSTLAIFAAGFIVRPFGAIFFGRLGDLLGRKSTFLLTLVLMGGSTFLIGLVPGYHSIGMAAPLIVLLLRLLQGLALGGEYGGAATYVAEHAPPGKRGFYTSWIQTTATLGLFLALGVIMLVKMNISDEKFNAEWGGWRYPFWFSIILVIVSVYIRLKMQESPLFAQLKSEGKIAKNPLKESFRKKGNFKMVLLALFGATMGQGVVWYTGQFYAQSFLETKVALSFEQSRLILLWAIVLATPFFIFFGWLSDKIGRKWVMLAGMLLAIVTYRPIFNQLLEDADVQQWSAENSTTTVKQQTKLLAHSTDSLILTTTLYKLSNGAQYAKEQTDTLQSASGKILEGKPVIKNKVLPHTGKYVLLVFLLIFYVTMVYGPIAAFLVELFPVHIRYTSMSLPYHIGNGVFGGLVPFIGVLLQTTFTTDPLIGLWYPIGIAALCFVIGLVYLNNKVTDH